MGRDQLVPPVVFRPQTLLARPYLGDGRVLQIFSLSLPGVGSNRILMKARRLLDAAVLIAFVLSGCGPKDDVQKAEAEVDKFHQHWNEWEFAAIYNEAHSGLRAVQSPDRIIATYKNSRKLRGAFKSAKKRSVDVDMNQPEKDITLWYDVFYENGSGVEMFT